MSWLETLYTQFCMAPTSKPLVCARALFTCTVGILRFSTIYFFFGCNNGKWSKQLSETLILFGRWNVDQSPNNCWLWLNMIQIWNKQRISLWIKRFWFETFYNRLIFTKASIVEQDSFKNTPSSFRPSSSFAHTFFYTYFFFDVIVVLCSLQIAFSFISVSICAV